MYEELGLDEDEGQRFICRWGGRNAAALRLRWGGELARVRCSAQHLAASLPFQPQKLPMHGAAAERLCSLAASLTQTKYVAPLPIILQLPGPAPQPGGLPHLGQDLLRCVWRRRQVSLESD